MLIKLYYFIYYKINSTNLSIYLSSVQQNISFLVEKVNSYMWWWLHLFVNYNVIPPLTVRSKSFVQVQSVILYKVNGFFVFHKVVSALRFIVCIKKPPHILPFRFFFLFCFYLQNVLKFLVQGLTIRARGTTATHARLWVTSSGLKCCWTGQEQVEIWKLNPLSTDPLESNGSRRALLGNHKFSHADRKFGNSVTRLGILH